MSTRTPFAPCWGVACAAALAACSAEVGPTWGRPAAGSEPVELAGGSWLHRRVVDPATGIEFVLIEPGEFVMGSVDGFDDEKPRHPVRLTKPFYLGVTEVTVGQWRAFAAAAGYRTDAERGVGSPGGKTIFPDGSFGDVAEASWSDPFPRIDSFGLREDHPVVMVSWNDAQAFCAAHGYRLPTEAEWEYAARAGSSENHWWGADPAGAAGKVNCLDATGKRAFPSFSMELPVDDGFALLAPVRSFEANPFGLFDVSGNVWEWTADGYVPDAYEGRIGGAVDPVVPEGEMGHTLRGGAWNSHETFLRVTRRVNNKNASRLCIYGFRVVRDV